MLAEDAGETLDVPCPRCKSTKGKKISETYFLALMKSYFEDGSVDLSVGNLQPKYRLHETEEKTFENLAIDSDLIQDCRMLHELTGVAVDLNYSRFINMGIWGCNAEILNIILETPSEENFDKLDELLTNILSMFKTETIQLGTKIFRIKKNLKHDITVDTAAVFDPQCFGDSGTELPSRDRFSASIIPVFYGAFEISTCLFECRTEYLEELTLGTFEVSKELKLLDLENFKDDISGQEREDVGSFISRMFYQRDYGINNFLSVMAFRLGFHGLKYCSYFSKIRSGRFMNVAIFGTPIGDGILKPVSFDRITIEDVDVKYSLGPVFQKQKEKQMIIEIRSSHRGDLESMLSGEEIEKMQIQNGKEDFDINIHSLAAVKRIYRG